MSLLKRYPLTSYYFLAYLFTWAIEVPMLLAVRGHIDIHLPVALEALAAFGPFAAAMLVLHQVYGSDAARDLLRSLFNWRVSPVWMAFAILSPFAVLFAALFITGETGKLFSGELSRNLVASGKMFELVVLGGVLRGIGEEPGWRGFALPVLRRRAGPLLATLALFPVWLCWHLPSFLMRPEFAWSAWLGFSAGILSAGIWCTFMYDATRSVLIVAIWHALINICRGFAMAASGAAFMAFAQVVLVIAVLVAIFWMARRPGPYVSDQPH
jgi:membrane protease YdiL (CAAX protease family)